MDRSHCLPDSSLSSRPGFEGLQISLDASSVSLFKQCPRKYLLEKILQWKKRNSSLALDFGSYYHKGLETYDKARTKGRSHDDALAQAIYATLIESGHYRLEGEAGSSVQHKPGEVIYLRAQGEGQQFKWRPFISDDNKRNIQTLLRSVVWHADQYEKDPIKTHVLANGEPAAEMSFAFMLGRKAPSGEDYIICGHIDRLGWFNDKLWVIDYKTTTSSPSSYYFDSYSPDNQVSHYTFSGQIITAQPITGVIIDAAFVQVTGTQFLRQPIYRTPDQTEEWLAELHWWISLMEQCWETGNYPMNDRACGLFGGCPFRGICSKSRSVRQAFLEAEFERKVWDPMIPR